MSESYKLVPAGGIFAVRVRVGNEIHNGMCYIGTRPTINGLTRNIEVNIFDFDRDIYNQKIRVEFINYIRGDMKFDSLDELKAQIAQDKRDAIRLLGSQ